MKSLFVISLLLAVGTLFPTDTYAAEVVVRTTQVVPPGSNTCAPLPVSGFTPYVYDNAAHSFEFYVPDSSYVAIAGTVGTANIPFNQMTRRVDAAGMLRIHVDTATMPSGNGLPVSVTMLSAKAGQPVCMVTVSTSIEGGGAAVTPSAPTSGGSTGAGTGSSGSQGASQSGGKPSNVSTGTSSATSAPPVVGGTGIAGGPACASSASATNLWVVLLVLYALVAGIAASGQLQIITDYKLEWTAAAIVVPFLLLFGIWFFVPTCRTGLWAPVVAILIALGGLAAAYWNIRKPVNVISLPAART